MSSAAVAFPQTAAGARVTSFCFLATFFCVTFEKVHWNFGGSLGIADVLTVLFLLAFALTQRGVMPRKAAIVLGFFAAFALVYLLGFFKIQPQLWIAHLTKCMMYIVVHFLSDVQ